MADTLLVETKLRDVAVTLEIKKDGNGCRLESVILDSDLPELALGQCDLAALADEEEIEECYRARDRKAKARRDRQDETNEEGTQ